MLLVLRLALPFCDADAETAHALQRLGVFSCADEGRSWAVAQLRACAERLGLAGPRAPGAPPPPPPQRGQALLAAVFPDAAIPASVDDGSMLPWWGWSHWPRRPREPPAGAPPKGCSAGWTDLAYRYTGLGHYLVLSHCPLRGAYFFRSDGGSNRYECADASRFYQQFPAAAEAPLVGARRALESMALERVPDCMVVTPV